MATDDPGPGARRRSESLLSGAGVLVVGRYTVAALAWVSTIIIVNRLTKAEFGEFTFIFTLLGIVGFIADLRLSRIVLSQVLAADETEAARVVGSYTGLRLVIGVVSYGVAMACVAIGSAAGEFSDQIVIGTALGGLNLIILSVAFGLILLFEARLWLRDVAVANVLGQVGSFALTVSVSLAGIGTVLWFVGANLVNGILVLVFIVFALRRGARIQISFERSEWWAWMREAAPLALGAALDTIYFRIDIVMLLILKSEVAVGIYSVGYKFSDLMGAVPIAVVTPALTLMVGAWPSDAAAFRRTFRHALVMLMVAAVGACSLFLVFAGPLVTTLYPGYRASVESARLLVVGQGLHFFTLLAFTTLVAVHRNRLYPIAMLVGVVINIGLNLVLIPEFSYLGSGWATVITECIVLMVLGIGVMRIPGLRPLPWRAMVKVIVAGLVAGGAGWALLGRVWWPVGLVTVAVLYLALVHFLAPNGPGGLRAFAGEPHDDLLAAVEEGIDRPDIGTGFSS